MAECRCDVVTGLYRVVRLQPRATARQTSDFPYCTAIRLILHFRVSVFGMLRHHETWLEHLFLKHCWLCNSRVYKKLIHMRKLLRTILYICADPGASRKNQNIQWKDGRRRKQNSSVTQHQCVTHQAQMRKLGRFYKFYTCEQPVFACINLHIR